MQKKLIALAVAGIVAGPAFAQSSVQIYGRIDASYIFKTNDLKGTLQDAESTNRLGILGEEDLGGGLKAFFQLEERFNIDDGTSTAYKDASKNTKALRWDDKSWVGLRHDKFGEILLGRAPSVLDTIYSGSFEAFGGDTIGQFPSRRAAYQSRINNGLRYTSPAFGGVKLLAHYGLTEASTGGTQTKVPFGFAATGTWGKATVEAGWQKDDANRYVDGSASPYKTWLVDGGYDFGVVKLVAGYARSKGYDDGRGNDFSKARQVRYQVGAIVPVGASGTLRADVGRGQERNTSGVIQPTYTHFGVGYWYGLSKRTTLMANAYYDKKKDSYYSTANQQDADNQAALQLAVRHEF